MTEAVWILWNHVKKVQGKEEWEHVDKKQEYAKEIFDRILSMTKHALTLIDNEEDYFITVPIILRSVLEGAVDLENLRNIDSYEKYMELVSRKEEYGFYMFYNEDFTNLIAEGKDYLSDYRVANPSSDYRRLLNEVIGAFNPKSEGELFSVGYKFSLLSAENNEKRHKRYRAVYDLLCVHGHHNIRFLNSEEVTDIKLFEIRYLDLIGSILKNGLINLFNIFERSIGKKSFNKLKTLKQDIIKGSQDCGSLDDIDIAKELEALELFFFSNKSKV